MTSSTRRHFLKQGGVGLLAFHVGGCEMELTPQQAEARGAALRVLTAAEATALGTLGDVLLPGSRAAGMAHYIDHQLAAPAASQLLMIRYLNMPPPFAPFYRDGLAALDNAAQAAHTAAFASLGPDEQRELVTAMARDNPPGWGDAPPSALFYFVVRSDALDVSYGTVEGFAQLGIPYRAHIQPPSRWGE